MAALTHRPGGDRPRALRRGALLEGCVALALGLAALTTVAWAAKDDLDLVSPASGAAGDLAANRAVPSLLFRRCAGRLGRRSMAPVTGPRTRSHRA